MPIIQKIRSYLKNEKGFNQIVVAMMLLAAGAIITGYVVKPFEGDGSTTGLPGAASSLVEDISSDITYE